MIEDIINSLIVYQQIVMAEDGNTLEQEEALDAQIKYMKECGELIKELNES